MRLLTLAACAAVTAHAQDDDLSMDLRLLTSNASNVTKSPNPTAKVQLGMDVKWGKAIKEASVIDQMIIMATMTQMTAWSGAMTTGIQGAIGGGETGGSFPGLLDSMYGNYGAVPMASSTNKTNSTKRQLTATPAASTDPETLTTIVGYSVSAPETAKFMTNIKAGGATDMAGALMKEMVNAVTVAKAKIGAAMASAMNAAANATPSLGDLLKGKVSDALAAAAQSTAKSISAADIAVREDLISGSAGTTTATPASLKAEGFSSKSGGASATSGSTTLTLACGALLGAVALVM